MLEQDSLAPPLMESVHGIQRKEKAVSQCLIHQNKERNSSEEKGIVRILNESLLATFYQRVRLDIKQRNNEPRHDRSVATYAQHSYID